MVVDTIEMEKNPAINKYADEKWLEMESPFAVYQGEELVDENLEEYGRYIELDEFQTEIIKAVNTMLFSNGQLIKKFLIRLGLDFDAEKLAKELKNLSRNKYLCKKSFVYTDGTKSASKVYTLGRKGKGFLKHNGMSIKLEGYINTRTPSQVKKILVANQTMLEIVGNDEDMFFRTSRMFAVDKKDSGSKLFRALGFINNWNAGKSYLIQPVRNEQNNVGELLDKLHRMEKVIKKVGTSGLKIADDLTVVVVAENKIWMEYFENIIKKQHYSYFKISMTYDRLIVSDKPLTEKMHYVKTASLIQKLLNIA